MAANCTEKADLFLIYQAQLFFGAMEYSNFHNIFAGLIYD